MIYDLFHTPKTIPTEAGTEYLGTYQEHINKKTGKLELEKTGETNVYDIIQTHAEEVKIENILHAVAMGDLSALQQREATYCDATTMPKNLMEAQNLVIRLKDEFYKMPVEVRKEFGNDPEVYVSEMGTEEFKKKMSPYNEKIAKIAEEKNYKEYQKKVQEGAQLNYDIKRAQAALEGKASSEGGENK